MARILIRNSDRRILFWTHDSLFSDINDFVNNIEARYPGDTLFLTISNPANVPANLRVGAYLNSTRDVVSLDPFGDVLLAVQRKAQLVAKLDEHQEAVQDGALTGIRADVALRWYKYLRMMAQVALRDDVISDAAQWALVEPSLDVDPYDLDGLTTAQAKLFDSGFADGGEYALGWYDIDSKTHPARTDQAGDEKLTSGDRYDYRFASKVRLIPESEIDRRDTVVFPATQPWTGRGAAVDAINERFPWYVNNSDSLLRNARFSPRIWPNFLPDRFARSGNFSSLISSALIIVHPRSHSATTRIVAGSLRSTTGTLTVPFTLGQIIPIVVTVTAGDGASTSSYTYTITRRAVN